LQILQEWLAHPGWTVFSRDFEDIRAAGVTSADKLFDTNEKWQQWRGKKQLLDYLLNYQFMTEDLIEKIESNDPSLSFTDEEDDQVNSLEA